MDLSVVVASHANPQGCYLTVFALLEQLCRTDWKLEWELIIASDGGSEYQWEKIPNVRCLRITTGSPQGTRDAGIRAARAASILVVEDHVVVSDLARFLESHKSLGGAMTFPARIGEGTSLFNVYGTETDWDGRLWFKRTLYDIPDSKPYQVPQFGHSCFMLDRAAYLAVGGYTDLLTGWGGEEPLLCLKFWMLGYKLWQIPDIWHAHFLADRTGGAMQTDAFTKNFRLMQYVIAGRTPPFAVTPAMREERERICAGPFGGDLTKLRDHLRREGIA
jgi:hypothetical protein